MLITAVEPRKKCMSALYIDGEFAMNLDTRTLIENHFDVGKEISDELLHQIIILSNERRAKEKALWLISYRDHSKKELKQKIMRTCDEQSAQTAVERMEELGLINDESYAKRYAEHLLFNKHMSKRTAVYSLIQKGIEREDAQNIVDDIEIDSCEQIRAIIDRKYKKINDEKVKRRAVSALQRLGFCWDEIKSVLSEYEEDDFYEL